MPSTGIVHVEWLNENQNRRYPFLDTATMLDSSGSVTVPNELVVDLTFPLQAFTDYDLTRFYLSAMTVFDGGVILTVSYMPGDTEIVVATRAVTYAEHTEGRAYYLEGVGDFADCVGRITIGKLDDVQKLGGMYTFDYAAAPLLPTVFRPTLRGVSGIRVVSADNEASALLSGDIELIAGDNVELELLSTDTGAQLTISAVNNPAWDASCSCAETTTGVCIQKINGVSPKDGNINLTSNSECLVISADAANNGIALTDSCASPCCGCNELNTLHDELARLASQIVTLQGFADRASASVDQLQTTILASKLGTCST